MNKAAFEAEIARLKKKSPLEFDMNYFIKKSTSEFDMAYFIKKENNVCGTTCCIAGDVALNSDNLDEVKLTEMLKDLEFASLHVPVKDTTGFENVLKDDCVYITELARKELGLNPGESYHVFYGNWFEDAPYERDDYDGGDLFDQITPAIAAEYLQECIDRDTVYVPDSVVLGILEKHNVQFS